MELAYSGLTITAPNRGLDLDVAPEENNHKRVLVIDDEIESSTLMKMVLMKAGFDVFSANNGPEAFEKCSGQKPDVILLDLMMPIMDGWDTYEGLKGCTNSPVIIVSALSEKEHIVRGFQIGADDYLTKPFHPAELVARVNRTLSRNHVSQERDLYYFPKIGLTIRVPHHAVTLDGKPVDLTVKEFNLLVLLARYAPELVTNEQISSELWQNKTGDVQNRIKHLVFVLRHKLEAFAPDVSFIENRERIGYRLLIN